jgi:hypothetical protein
MSFARERTAKTIKPERNAWSGAAKRSGARSNNRSMQRMSEASNRSGIIERLNNPIANSEIACVNPPGQLAQYCFSLFLHHHGI